MKIKPLTFLLSITFLFLFSGSVFGGEQEVKKEYWDNGKVKSETHFKNGKKEGLETSWFENGEKMSESYYKDGKIEGLHTVWFENGKKKSIKHYKDGVQNGLWTEWDEYGKKRFQININCESGSCVGIK